MDLVAASHRSFIGSYRLLTKHVSGGTTYEGHGVFAFTTGVGMSIFNGCIALEEASEEAFGSALDWLLRHDLPWRVWVHEPAVGRLGGVATAFGLARQADVYPGMAMHPIPPRPADPPGIAVEAVDGDGEACLVAAYARIGRDADFVTRLFGPAFRGDPDVRMFCARLNGEPVGTSLALRTGDVAGVYAVGTAKDARKRGVGTAATWAAIDAAMGWRARTVVLQSSSMGLSIYRAMGFRTVASYVTYLRADPA